MGNVQPGGPVSTKGCCSYSAAPVTGLQVAKGCTTFSANEADVRNIQCLLKADFNLENFNWGNRFPAIGLVLNRIPKVKRSEKKEHIEVKLPFWTKHFQTWE